MRYRTFTGSALLLLFAVVSVPSVRPQTNEQTKKRGQSFVAEKQVRDETKENGNRNEPPRDGAEWFARGYQMHGSDRYPEAIEAFKHAAELGYRKATAMYNIACGYSLLNDKENALAWLQRALDNGFDGAELVTDDSDLDPLRTDARFKKIVARLPNDNDREGERNAKSYAEHDRVQQANLDFARLTRESSTEGEEWAKVGVKLLLLRDLDRSISALLQAVAYLDEKGASSMYNLACAYSLKGDPNAGILWLERAVNAGFDSPEKLRNDPDITNLRSDSRFSRIDKLSNTLTLSQFNSDRDNFKDSESYNYSKERWAPAIVLYESFVKREPSNGRAWFNLGYALHYSREHTKAIAAFEHALALGYHKPTSTYNIACAYAMLNQRDLAFEWLNRAVDAGFDSSGKLSWDRDLDNLRSDPRFTRFAGSDSYNTKLRKKK
jgi:tetratricopeptide (TPR) repeat protein